MCPYSGCVRPRFTRNSDVKRHINSVHLNRRVYACTAAGCGKAYTRGAKLTAHIQMAHGMVDVEGDDKIDADGEEEEVEKGGAVA